MRLKCRCLFCATVVLPLVAGCESLADREHAADLRDPAQYEYTVALRDEARWDAQPRRQSQQPLPLWPGYPATCPVHGSPLREDVVPVVYGTPAFTPEYLEYLNAHRLFPYSSETVDMGFGGGPTQAHVKYCPDCRAVAARLKREAGWRMAKRIVWQLLPEESILPLAAARATVGAIAPPPFIAAMWLNSPVDVTEPH